MLISLDDPAVLWDKLSRTNLLSRLSPLALSSEARVKSRWKSAAEPLRHWLQIPLVQRRVRRRISGDESKTFKQFACERYLGSKSSPDVLFLGCGNGVNALDWAKEGSFTSMLGIDLSPPLVEAAQRAAQEAGVAHKCAFRVADVNTLDLREQRFDAVIFEHSLHHFKDVPAVLARARQLLRPGGLLLADEFVGPRRFQWTEQQIAFCDAILAGLPEKFHRTGRGGLKNRHHRAGELLMWLNDPSEAIESDRIRPALTAQFKVLENRDYGGTLSHLVFQDIAHHFATDDADARRWGDAILDAEEELMTSGLIKSDFACFVCS
jgi:SAM-dependent methyltransferase